MSNRNDCFVSPRISGKALNAFLAHFRAGADELHTLSVYEHDALSTPPQPLLSTMKTIRDQIDF